MKKTYNKKSKEDKEKEVNELLKKANEGIENYFTTPEHFKELASYMSKFYNYSFRNIFLIQEQFEGALAVGSYAFWKEKGFTVNKGEKGIKILVPNKLSDYFINEKGEEVKLSKATLEEKSLIEQGEIEVRKGKLIFNQGYVFEVTQTNAKAKDLPKIFPGRWLDGEVNNYNLMYKAMENIANKIGVKIIEPKKELGAVKGVSYPVTKEVALNPRNTQLQNVKTLIHELTHAKLHTMETRDNYTTNAKEFQAEMAAYVVCSYFGLDTSEYSFRYIKNWTKGVELKDKEKLINEVRETVKEYIEIIEETLINNKDKSLLLENENIVEKEIKDEKLRNFLGKDRVVINEITRDELEKIINESNSNVFLKRDEELSIKNEVVAMKVKGKYRDVYIGTDYKLDNLIYVDDNKNLYRIKENIEYDKSLYGIKEQEIMKDLEEKSIESDDWKLSDRDLDSVSFNVMKNTIEELMKENYGDFVRAIISIESGIEDLDILDNIHEKYMDSDFKLINDKFEDLKNEIEREKLDVRDEKKEKEIWRKIREHEEWIKSNGLRGQQLNLENENLSGMRLINLDLRDANFKGADMTQCVIFADLRGADLTGVKINNSEWIGSNINNVTIEANKLNLIEYQMEQEKDVHLASMDKLKTKTKEKEIKM
ncbi:ImmA/IrrE family metallo-endopeptidase [Clostridium sp. K04]|jgi:NACalpha-BTF3-like transcription factor|uniref:ImmA/IrrE family metallo-endopeptidase n=1 Tax=Clostridium sp. K04 TaxID=2718929 RepID=UPI001C8B3ECF|nr:ImmA/IrrE family metallo-endopeptidase [Clostridium sp. K04]MBX9185262.1 ImmA/IrrE family metallo-endopeptidase [Clostridium sp. K04]